jgi:hypothetical protein
MCMRGSYNPNFQQFCLFSVCVCTLIHHRYIRVYMCNKLVFVVCLDSSIGRFREFLEDLCSKAESNSDHLDEAVEWLPLPLSDLRTLVNEIMTIREKKLLHLVPVELLVRLLKVLDHQIHRAEGLSIDDCDNVSSC